MQVRTRYRGASFPIHRASPARNSLKPLMRDNARRARPNRASFERAERERNGPLRDHRHNNNNSDSGYFAYSNNRILLPARSLSLLPSVSRCVPRRFSKPARALLAPALQHRRISRFAWQVTRNLFACQRTRLSPLIPPSELLRASKRFTYPRLTPELLLMLPVSIGSDASDDLQSE